jgi:hypothetical protein
LIVSICTGSGERKERDRSGISLRRPKACPWVSLSADTGGGPSHGVQAGTGRTSHWILRLDSHAARPRRVDEKNDGGASCDTNAFPTPTLLACAAVPSSLGLGSSSAAPVDAARRARAIITFGGSSAVGGQVREWQTGRLRTWRDAKPG